MPETRTSADLRDRYNEISALAAHADILLTGDKDFLEASLTKPRILSPADFLGWRLTL